MPSLKRSVLSILFSILFIGSISASEFTLNCNIDKYMSSASENDGAASVSITGGSAPFTFSWSNGASTQSVTGLGAGVYTVVVTDSDGDVDSCSVEIRTHLPIPNPDLDPSCHMDVIIILDESTSIRGNSSSDDIRQEVKDACYAMLQNFIGTSTRVRIVEFNRTARRGIVGGITDYQLVDATSINDFQFYLYGNPNDGNATADHYDAEDNVGQMGWTNWEDAFNEVEQINIETAISPLVMMITDGVPTAYNNNSGTTTQGADAVTTTDALSNAVGAANKIKLQGSHIFVVGIPNPNLPENNIRQVSDPDRYPDLEPDYRKGDYSVTNSGNIEALMAAIGASICKADLSLTKTVDKSVVCQAGDTVTFTITIANAGIEDATGVQVKDSIPSGYTYLSNSELTITQLSGNILLWNIDTLWVDSVMTLELKMLVNSSGDYKNVAQVSASDLEDVDSTPNNDDGDQSEDDEDYAEVTLSDLDLNLQLDSIKCYGESNAVITANVNGSSSTYSFLWNTGDTIQSISNLGPGWYSVTVSDALGCNTQDSVFVPEPDSLYCVIDGGNIPCFEENNTGWSSVDVFGGTKNYTYEWNNGSNQDSIVNLGEGTYTVDITDAHNCVTNCSFEVLRAPELLLSLLADSVSCHGLSDGKAKAEATGGTQPYRYTWSSGETDSSIVNKPSGWYFATVTDANNCSKTDSIFISEPDSIIINELATPVKCFGDSTGSAFIEVRGANGDYSYTWTPTGTPGDTSLQNLTTGTYKVLVEDAEGCKDSATIAINEPDDIFINTNSNPVDCHGGSNGTAVVVASGGTPTLSYLWNTGSNNIALGNLSAGLYSVVVTDGNGCEKIDSVEVIEPDTITLDIIVDSVTCKNESTGALYFSANGGNGGYTYQVNNQQIPDTFLTNLPAGSYSVEVTDSKGCSKDTVVSIFEPEILHASLSQDSVSCKGSSDGSVVAQVSGGSKPYSYLWNTGETDSLILNKPIGVYAVIVTDKNNCQVTDSIQILEPDSIIINEFGTPNLCKSDDSGNAFIEVRGANGDYTYTWTPTGSPGDTSLQNLTAGTYKVVVEDIKGCKDSASIVITEPDSLLITLSSDSVSCFGTQTGSASVSTTGGTPNYSYLWQNGDTLNTSNNLVAGWYNVTVTDANGCQTTDSVEIKEPVPLQLFVSSDSVLCHGTSTGIIHMSASGGNGNFVYQLNGQVIPSNIVTGLPAGDYTIKVTDEKGCEKDTTLKVYEPDALQITLTQDSVSCKGLSDGKAFVEVFGGSAPYSYLWNTGETDSLISNMPDGLYYVTVTDKNNCQVTDSIKILEPDSIIINEFGTPVLCYGDATGNAFIEVRGANGDYTYTWTPSGSPGDTSLQNLSIGTYKVVVEDIKGCRDSASIEITEPENLSITLTADSVACFGEANGEANVTVNGGVPAYQFLWSNGDTTSSTTSLLAGWYSVLVTDKNGCQINDSVYVGQPDSLYATVIYDTLICAETDVRFEFDVYGGLAPYVISINDVSISDTTIVNMAYQPEYIIRVRDRNNCLFNLDTAKIKEYRIEDREFALEANKQEFCVGDSVVVSLNSEASYNSLEWINHPNWIGEGPFSFFITSDTLIEVVLTDTCGFDLPKALPLTYHREPIICDELFGDTVCAPLDSLILDTCSQLFSSATVSWFVDNQLREINNSNGFRIHEPEAGTYELKREIVTNNVCEYTFIDSGLFVVHPTPNVDFILDKYILDAREPIVQTENFSTDLLEWMWDFGDSEKDSLVWEPTHTYDDIGEFTITLMGKNEFNCVAKKRRPLKIEVEHIIKVPTAFMPGGNGGNYIRGQNDVFYAIADKIEHFHMMIFNRWGEIVFESFELDFGWDGIYKGEISQQDVYVYKIYATFIDGFKYKDVGSFTLLR